MAPTFSSLYGPNQQKYDELYNDLQVILTLRSDYFDLIKHDLAFALKYDYVEGCSYGLIARIFGTLASAITHTNDPRIRLDIHPQGPLFDRRERKTDAPKLEIDKSRRIPDFLALLTDLAVSGSLLEADMGFWIEAKVAAEFHLSKSDRSEANINGRFKKTIVQMNWQAAFAFHTIKRGNRFYAFLIHVPQFGLLRYERPTGTATVGPDGIVIPPMPDAPKVLYWNQPILTKKATGYTRVFLEAIHMLMNELQLTIQPSWFDITEEHPLFSKKDLEDMEDARALGQELVDEAMLEEDAAAEEVEADQEAEAEAEEAKTAPSSMTKDPNYGGLDIKEINELDSDSESVGFPTMIRTARQESLHAAKEAAKAAEAEKKKNQEKDDLAAAAKDSGRPGRKGNRSRRGGAQ